MREQQPCSEDGAGKTFFAQDQEAGRIKAGGGTLAACREEGGRQLRRVELSRGESRWWTRQQAVDDAVAAGGCFLVYVFPSDDRRTERTAGGVE